MVIEDGLDWNEVPELIVDGFCIQEPKKLVAHVVDASRLASECRCCRVPRRVQRHGRGRGTALCRSIRAGVTAADSVC